jgi:hypothetical protein
MRTPMSAPRLALTLALCWLTAPACFRNRSKPPNPSAGGNGASDMSRVALSDAGDMSATSADLATHADDLGATPADAAARTFATTITNFSALGQVTLFDVEGNAVDAHDGHIALFGGVYYLYGTSYDCGFSWRQASTPFCGFKVYSSTDLAHWTDRGFLFDGTTSTWQQRCNGSTYGCFRPHVIYNANTKKYVLWINVYDNSSGYRVLLSDAPVGPFAEIAEPVLSATVGLGAGLNNGDHALFVDDDSAHTAYIAYTNWNTGGKIAIEQLDAAYATRAGGNGTYSPGVTAGATEAPALFKRNGIYYLTYSDPNCGYCGSGDGTSKTQGTGTSYRTAASPLGPWSAAQSVVSGSCGGQPSFVSPIPTADGTAYLYGSDLWRNGASNEALANYFWAPLRFGADGSIQTLSCDDQITLTLTVGGEDTGKPPANVDAWSGYEGFSFYCDVQGTVERAQSFVVTRTGRLSSVSYTTFVHGTPNAPLVLALYRADAAGQPTGAVLASASFAPNALGWSARKVGLQPNLAVTAGSGYALVASSATSSDCYGVEYSNANPYPAGKESYSNNSGGTLTVEVGRTLKFETTIDP